MFHEIKALNQTGIDAQNEIKRLKVEKAKLSAQLSQIKQSGQVNKIDLDIVEEHNTNDEKLYEVEKILDHRTTQSYLIRWKNYGPEEDSWVSAENMNCRKILKQYLKSVA